MCIEFDPEDILECDDERDCCPECGHAWLDGRTDHYHDCRYFELDAEDDEDILVTPDPEFELRFS